MKLASPARHVVAGSSLRRARAKRPSEPRSAGPTRRRPQSPRRITSIHDRPAIRATTMSRGSDRRIQAGDDPRSVGCRGPAELAGLYMRQNRISEAMTAAEQALKIAPGNSEAHRVLGTIYAALAESDDKPGGGWFRQRQAEENAKKAIGHLEEALATAGGRDRSQSARERWRVCTSTPAPTTRRFRCCAIS